MCWSIRTAPLDHDVTIFGPITVDLKVSTTGTDSDFDVKLIDVFPNDYPDFNAPPPAAPHLEHAASRCVADGRISAVDPRRAFPWQVPQRIREARALRAKKPDRITYKLPDVRILSAPGHRIMVQVQSSLFPLTDRNPQKFLDIPKGQARGLCEGGPQHASRRRRRIENRVSGGGVRH